MPNAPASVALQDYWRAQGMGGDGLNVFTFSIAHRDIAEWMEAQNYRVVPPDDDVATLILKVEIEKVEQRTGTRFPLIAPYTRYASYLGGRQNHCLFDTNSPANAVFWSYPGPPLESAPTHQP